MSFRIPINTEYYKKGSEGLKANKYKCAHCGSTLYSKEMYDVMFSDSGSFGGGASPKANCYTCIKTMCDLYNMSIPEIVLTDHDEIISLKEQIKSIVELLQKGE